MVYKIFILLIFLEIFFRLIYYFKKKKFSLFWQEINKVKNFKPHPYIFYVKEKNSNNYLYPSNNYGYVGKRKINKKKKKNVLRFYFAGGSTTEDIDPKEGPDSHWPQQLINNLSKRFKKSKFECINAGCSGYTSAESLSEFIFRGIDFKPDFLIIYHNINDAWSAQMVDGFKSDYSHSRIVKSFHTIIEKLPLIPFFFIKKFDKKKLNYLLSKNSLIYYISSPLWKISPRLNEEKTNVFKRNIKNLITISRSCGCVPILINWEGNLENLNMPNLFKNCTPKSFKKILKHSVEKNNKALKYLAKKEKCIYYNLGPFKKHCFREDGVHFNTKGIEEFSKKLSKKIEIKLKSQYSKI